VRLVPLHESEEHTEASAVLPSSSAMKQGLVQSYGGQSAPGVQAWTLPRRVRQLTLSGTPALQDIAMPFTHCADASGVQEPASLSGTQATHAVSVRVG
jgi:hypothetical protein